MSCMTQRYQVIAESIFEGTNLDSHATRGANDHEHRKNVDILRYSYRLWFTILADFCLQANLSCQHTEAQLLRLRKVVESTTYLELSTECGALYDVIRVLPTYESFKFSSFKEMSPSGFIYILKPFIENVRSQRDAGWIQCILTLCVFPFRTRIVDSNLQEQMLASYLEIENEIARNDSNGYPKGLIRDLNRIIRRWIGDWDEPVVPSLTAGTVSDPTLNSMSKKYSSLCEDSLIDYLLRKEQQTSVAFYAPCSLLERDRVERVIFVPKNATKLRTVCCQPVTLQYFQSGVIESMYRHIASKPYLRRHIPLGDQEVPRRLAAQGSKYSTLATLDLSAASDRISWSLVKQVFANTRYLRWMCATRAPYSYLPNGDTILSQKAFAMGACLCFPTMSLLLAAVVSYCEQRKNDHLRSWTVYGDDIICPVEWVQPVVLILTRLGLVVNESKSFFGFNDSYRESCGKEAWNGYDVTPLRFPRTFSPTAQRAKLTTELVALANDFFDRDLRISRLECMSQLAKCCNVGPYSKHSFAFTDNPICYTQHFNPEFPWYPSRVTKEYSWAGFLATSEATNYKAHRKRWHRLQHWEVRCYYCTTKRRQVIQPDEGQDDLRYFDYLLQQYRKSMLINASSTSEAYAVDAYAFAAQLTPSLRIGWRCPS